MTTGAEILLKWLQDGAADAALYATGHDEMHPSFGDERYWDGIRETYESCIEQVQNLIQAGALR